MKNFSLSYGKKILSLSVSGAMMLGSGNVFAMYPGSRKKAFSKQSTSSSQSKSSTNRLLDYTEIVLECVELSDSYEIRSLYKNKYYIFVEGIASKIAKVASLSSSNSELNDAVKPLILGGMAMLLKFHVLNAVYYKNFNDQTDMINQLNTLSNYINVMPSTDVDVLRKIPKVLKSDIAYFDKNYNIIMSKMSDFLTFLHNSIEKIQSIDGLSQEQIDSINDLKKYFDDFIKCLKTDTKK